MKTVRIAQRVQESNSIGKMLDLARDIDTSRAKQGLQPLHNLCIGSPHVPSNPVLDLAFLKWLDKKQKLREKLEQLQVLQSQPQTEQQKQQNMNEYKITQSKLVQMDTYQSSQGTLKARIAASQLVNHYYPFLQAEPRHCCVTNGSSQALNVIFQVFVEPGVVVATFAPFFPAYKRAVEAIGGTFECVPASETGRPRVELLDEFLRSYPVSMFVINDPCNPSGTKLTRQELASIGNVLAKPEHSHIIVVCDEAYHDLIYAEDEKYLFLDVVDKEVFKKRSCVILSCSKSMAAAPGLRFGLIYAPDMTINGKTELIGTKLGTLMLDTTCAVSTAVQYAGEKVILSKLGLGNKEWVEITRKWESNLLTLFKESIQYGVSLFHEGSKFPLVVKPEGAFYGIISAQCLLGKSVPDTVQLVNGTSVSGIRAKVESDVFKTDTHIAHFLLYAAEVTTVPASGFLWSPTVGYLRISFAITQETCKKAAQAMCYAAEQVI